MAACWRTCEVASEYGAALVCSLVEAVNFRAGEEEKTGPHLKVAVCFPECLLTVRNPRFCRWSSCSVWACGAGRSV